MIDAHQHFWDISRKDCVWPTRDMQVIFRSFDMPAYEEEIKEYNFTGSVLVQSQASDSDTDYIVDLASRYENILAVVGWVDFERDDACDRIESLAKHKKLKGLRPMLQSIDDSAWILQEKLGKAIKSMQAQGLCFDALIQPRHLSYIYDFAVRYPDLAVVVDHAAKPNIAKGEFIYWADGLQRVSALDNVFCKLSGLFTEANKEQIADDQTILPYVRHICKSFGAKRIMWGSDWPVVNLVSSFKGWLHSSERLLDKFFDDDEKNCVFFETAKKFYRI